MFTSIELLQIVKQITLLKCYQSELYTQYISMRSEWMTEHFSLRQRLIIHLL